MSTEEVFEDPEWLAMLKICTLCSLPIALKAAINLGVFDVLNESDEDKPSRGPNQLSSTQIVARLQQHPRGSYTTPAAPAPNAHSLDRILRLLASHSILTSSTALTASTEIPITLYGLTPLCKHVLRGSAFSLIASFINSRPFLEAWGRVDEGLLNSECRPFTLAHSKDLFTYAQENPEFSNLFNTAMDKFSGAPMKWLVHESKYGIFCGIRSLVDVGGNLGASVHEIVLKHPQIKGINFDLPHVIEEARRLNAYPCVEHIEGSMFDSIPKADAIFMKHVLNDWADDECIQILKNCYDAIPTGGKVIVMEVAMPTTVNRDPVSQASYQLDLCMFAHTPGGRGRTLDEFRALAKAVGLASPQVRGRVNHMSILEFVKP